MTRIIWTTIVGAKIWALLIARLVVAAVTITMMPVVAKADESQPPGGALAGERLRLIISTDIGGSDPDDFQSFIHFLMYAELFDLEGLISSPPGSGRAEHLLEALDVYAQDYSRILRYSPAHPAPDQLRSLVKQGAIDAAPAAGYSHPTEGSNWIIQQAKHADSRPLWVLVWGSITDVAQALHDAPDIAGRLRVYFISSWNRHMDTAARNYVVDHHPQLWFIECDSSFRGMYVGGDQSTGLGNRDFVQQSVRGHGASGDYFFHKKADIKMGDTPSLLYLMRGDTENPAGPSWGGSFHQPDPNRPYWTDRQETQWNEGRYPGAKTVNRWRTAILDDWRQRMAWLTNPPTKGTVD